MPDLDDGGRSGFLDEPHDATPSAFIQWKGTDVCMDFYCDCGAQGHFDGDFAYAVKCQHCGQIWEMPCKLYPRKASHATDQYWVENAKMLEPDEEFCDAVEVNGVWEMRPRPVPQGGY